MITNEENEKARDYFPYVSPAAVYIPRPLHLKSCSAGRCSAFHCERRYGGGVFHVIWILALVIPAIFCLLFNLVLEGTDDEEEVGADPLEQPHEGADDVIRR